MPGGINIDNNFPGSKNGTHVQRITSLFTEEIFKHADVCVDLQTGLLNHTNLPQILTDLDNPQSKELAAHFQAPVISMKKPERGSLQAMAHRKGKSFLLYKAGQAMHFDSQAISVGVKGLENIMKKLNMIKPNLKVKEGKKAPSFCFSNGSIAIRASKSGIAHSACRIGDIINKGELVGVIKDPFGSSDDIAVKSAERGIIIEKNNLPLVYEGTAVFKMAIFDEMENAAEHIEKWSQEEISKKSNDEKA